MMDEKLYKDELLEHYRYPRNYGVLANAQVSGEVLNPSCGDEVSLQIGIDHARVSAIRFQGKGCVISQAAASLLTEFCLNKPLKALEALTKDDMLALMHIELGPTRLRCALLSLEALHQALIQYEASREAQRGK